MTVSELYLTPDGKAISKRLLSANKIIFQMLQKVPNMEQLLKKAIANTFTHKIHATCLIPKSYLGPQQYQSWSIL